jgi:pimeloyl-ACP methyl ester carboxylesterase
MQPVLHTIQVPNTMAGQGTHELAFYDWGDPLASHTVVCVHGLTRNGRDFDLLGQELAKRGRRVLALSMAGRGESEWLADTADYNYYSYAQDCLKILDNFHLRQVDWVGTSMGGIIGMLIASQSENRIRKLVVNDIGTLLKKEALARIYTYVQSIPPSFPDRAAADAYLRDVFAPFGICDLPVWQDFVSSSLLPAADGVKLAVDPRILEPLRTETHNFTVIEDVNIAELWGKIDIPALILRGEQSDILDAETVSAMRATNPRAEARLIKDVGHAPSLMVPEQIAMVADWLMAPGFRIAGL